MNHEQVATLAVALNNSMNIANSVITANREDRKGSPYDCGDRHINRR
jgi:hypothetical protein